MADPGATTPYPTMFRGSLIVSMIAVGAIMNISVTLADPQTRQDAKGRNIEVFGLIKEPGSPCHPIDFAGTVVKREFASDALTITGIVIEEADGTRTFINIDIPKDLNLGLRDNVYRGVQQLTKIGRKARGRGLACGVGGRFLTLDEIR